MRVALSKKDKKSEPVRTNKFSVLSLSDDSDSDAGSDSDADAKQKEEPIVVKKEVKASESREFWSKKTQVKRETDGWNTVQPKPRPNFIVEDDEEKAIRREMEEEAKMEGADEGLGGGTHPAQIWADKIRESLERAEASRSAPKALSNDFISSLDKLSFFRRPAGLSSIG
jgi:hypothetical protein